MQETRARLDTMMVEFIGAAGAGKTYVSNLVLEALNSKGVSATDFDRIKINWLAPRSLFLTARAFFLTVRARQTTVSRFVHTFKTIARYSIRRELCEQAAGIYITSEGLLHRIISIHRYGRKVGFHQLAHLFYRKIQPPDLIVAVEISPQTAFARRSARNRADDRFSRESVRADVEIIGEAMDVMATLRLNLCPSMKMLWVNSEQEGAKQAVGEIVAALAPGVHL